MDTDNASSTAEPSGEPRPPRLFAPLPGRTEDSSVAYERCLTELLDLLGAPRPSRTSDASRREWQHQARRVIATAADRAPVREELFEPLVRAAVYDSDPSFNRQLIAPALAAFGRRRVQLALLEYLRTGTNPERAGAARAWYWTNVPVTYRGGSPMPERKAEHDADSDLRREWRDTALRVFVTNEHLDVRRCILPGLDLRAQHYPEELRPTVAAAIHIARTHSDEYVRHRVEHQV